MGLTKFNTLLRVTRTAFSTQVGNQVLHQGQVGTVALVAALLHHRHQLRMGQGFQMKRKVGGRHLQGTADFTSDQTLWTSFDQQAIDVEPHARGEGFKNASGQLFVYDLIIQHLLK